MPPKATSSLAGMLQSDDSDVEMLDENSAPPKKPVARKPRKAKPASKRLSGSKRKAPAKSTKRAPLVERSNEQHPADDTEEVDEFAEEQPQPDDDQGEQDQDTEPEIKPARKRGRPPGKKADGKQALSKEQAQELEEVVEHAPNDPKNRPPGAKIKSAATRRGAQTKAALPAESAPAEEIAESQVVENDLDDSGLQEDQIPQSIFKRSNHGSASSRQPQPMASRGGHRRIGSNSDSERVGDATLRRKLGDVTKKYENLQDRYAKLVEVGIKEAEANFERLKQQSQAQEKAANDLIASLRADLAAAQKAVSQTTSLSTQITKAKEQAKVGDEKLRISESQLATLTEKLNLAQTDNKNLQAKLAVARTAPTAAPKVPGSAAKNRNAIGNATAAAEVAIGQLKEDLYSDLTGLILRNVEQNKDADVFDCLQTGRNGTLHFRLSVDHVEEGVAFEETEFQYTPRLDEARDRELLEILPDYLTEEITFSRTNAAKFYSRINDTLTRKLD